MVTGGKPDGKSAELLNIDGNKLCSLPSLPAARFDHSQTGLITCGGGQEAEQTTCVTLSSGRWKKTHTLGTRRWGHFGVASPLGVLLVGVDKGGTYGKSVSSTTELLTDNGDTKSSFTLRNRQQ